MFDNQIVYFGLIILILCLKLLYKFKFFFVYVLLSLRTSNAVDFLKLELYLLVRVLNLIDVSTNERFIHLVLVSQMRKRV